MKHSLLMRNAMLAAAYAVLTIAIAPLSYGFMQIRLSECMTLAAFYDKRYMPGLVIGCLLANFNSPLGIVDLVIGTMATFLSVWNMQYCKNIYIASLMPVLFNAICIGGELYILELLPEGTALLASMLYVAGGEFLAVSVAGICIMKLGLEKIFATQTNK